MCESRVVWASSRVPRGQTPGLLCGDCLFDISSRAATQRAQQAASAFHLFLHPSYSHPLIPRHSPPPLCWHTWGRTEPQQLNTCAHLHAAINSTVSNHFLWINNSEIFSGLSSLESFWIIIQNPERERRQELKAFCRSSLTCTCTIISDGEAEGLLLRNRYKENPFPQTRWQSDVISPILTWYQEWSKIMKWSTDTELCTYMHYLRLLPPPIRTGSRPYWITWPFRKAMLPF